MISSVILEEKWRTQERLAKKAGYDMKTYLKNVDKIVRKMEKDRGASFKYAKVRPVKFHDLSIGGVSPKPGV